MADGQLRTVTYVVKMDIGDGEKKTKDFRLTLKTMEQDTKKASAEVDKLAKTIGEKYNTKVTTAIDETRTVKNEISQSAREASKADRQFSNLSKEYALLASRVGKTSDEQEKLNALYRLGAGATEEQRRSLSQQIDAYQKLRRESNKTQGSMRGLRGQMQNVGYQFQDIAVQAQMGTDALIILSQQGSQLAAGFGATGALVGAGLAVVGMLAYMGTNLSNTGKKVGDFKADIDELASSLRGLDEMGEFQLARIFLTSTQKLKALGKEYAKFDKDVEKANRAVSIYQRSILNQENSIAELRKGNLSEEFDSRGRAYAVYTDQERKLAIEVAEAQKKRAQSSLTASRVDQIQAKASLEGVEKQITAQRNLQNEINKRRTGAQTASQAKEVDELIARNRENAETLGLSAVELAKYNKEKERQELVDKKALDVQIRANDAYWDEVIAKEKATEATKEKAEAEKEAKKQALERIRAERNAQKEIDQMLQTGAKYSSDFKLALLQRQYAEERAMFAGNVELLQEIDQHYANERLKINGDVWDRMAIQAQESLERTDELMFESMDRFVSSTADAFASAIVNADSFGDAMKSIFIGATQAMISYFAELAIQQALAWAFKSAGEQSAQAGVATQQAVQNEAVAVQASLNALTSMAGAPFPLNLTAPAFSASMGAVAQGLAGASSALWATSATIPTFDKGGFIPSGSAGIVSEFGDELVGGTMVYNGSPNSLRVTGREDTARMMGGGTSIGSITVNSNGNASPEAIARAIARILKKPNKSVDNAVFSSMERGRRNGGKRFA